MTNNYVIMDVRNAAIGHSAIDVYLMNELPKEHSQDNRAYIFNDYNGNVYSFDESTASWGQPKSIEEIIENIVALANDKGATLGFMATGDHERALGFYNKEILARISTSDTRIGTKGVYLFERGENPYVAGQIIEEVVAPPTRHK